jgi:hypothetical protein
MSKIDALLEAAKKVEKIKQGIASMALHYLGESAGNSFYYDMQRTNSDESIFEKFEKCFAEYTQAKHELLLAAHPELLQTEVLRAEKSPIFCEHANECPAQCPCGSDCYCKEHTCKGR